MATSRSLLTAVDDLRLEPVGSWTIWDREAAERRPDLGEAVQRFEAPGHPAGREATRWLREDALDNDPSTRTYLLEHEETLQGFFACCAGVVDLTPEDAAGIGVIPRARLPAFVLAWVARSCNSTVEGIHLMVTAHGLARELSRSVGLVAFALDPMDERVARMWQSEPYGFRQTRSKPRGRRPPRLWLPLQA